MTVFDHSQYKDFLTEFIKNSQQRGVLSELARAAGCTHSYLSQVLNGNAELTPDQALAIADHLTLSTDESDYFFLLVLHSRSATPKLKNNLQKKLDGLKQQQLKTGKILSRSEQKLNLAQRDRYYGQIDISIIHTLTSSDRYQTAESIAKRLRLPMNEVTAHLNWLADQNLVELKNSKYTHNGSNVHLPTEAIHNHMNHLNWRLKAVQNYADDESIHYTSAFTIGEKDWPVLKSDLIAFIKAQRKKIQSSVSDEGFVFCCDLFKV